MRKGVIAQFSSFGELKTHLDQQRNMEVVAARQRDVQAAQRLARASSLPKPKQGKRVAKAA